MTRLSCALLIVITSTPATAVADSCFPAHSVFYPGGVPAYGSRGEVVGRDCTIQLQNPAEQLISGYDWVDVSKLELVAGEREIPFVLTGPTTEIVLREAGCDPPGSPNNTFGEVVYHYYVITPEEPLPAESEIEVKVGERVLVSFTTTADLDTTGCESKLGPPSLSVCSPGIQNCIGGIDDGEDEGGCQLAGRPAAPGLLALALALALARRRRG